MPRQAPAVFLAACADGTSVLSLLLLLCADTILQEGEEFRRALIRYESEMLKAFGFIMNVEHPHRLLCNYCQILFAPYMDKPDKQGFLQTFIQESWNVANDRCVRARVGVGTQLQVLGVPLLFAELVAIAWLVCARPLSQEGHDPLLCMGACQ